jgi:hypothetical protein
MPTRTLTLAEAAQLWAPAQVADHDTPAVWDTIFTGTAKARFTGIIDGPDVADNDGQTWHPVFEIERGEVTDRYMSKSGVQL